MMGLGDITEQESILASCRRRPHFRFKRLPAVLDRAAQVIQGALLDMQPAVRLHAARAEGVLASQTRTFGASNFLQADTTGPHSLCPPVHSRMPMFTVPGQKFARQA